jgi:Uncharacterised nucleotidyltransferase
MGAAASTKKSGHGARTLLFYREAAQVLSAAGVPFLVGGGLALAQYTRVVRDTKDLDVFVRPGDARAALKALARAGYRTEMTFPHWLGKAFHHGAYVDVIFSSGNGVAVVDEEWFEHARTARIFDLELKICPPEEILWSKAFILERERFDGADVNHLLHDYEGMDWDRLLRRFGGHWRVLLAHLILFGYVYPGRRHRIPAWVMDELLKLLADENRAASPRQRVCQGTLLSREQYLVDIEQLGYEDPRITDPSVQMTRKDVVLWTRAIPGKSPTSETPARRRRRPRAKTGH